MSVKPILFKTSEEIRAILDGRKTVTRRVIKRDIINSCDIDTDGTIIGYCDGDGDWHNISRICRYHPGDIFYVRETWCTIRDGDKERYAYRADGMFPSLKDRVFIHATWHPSIYMPKEATRIWLKVTDVRVERLQDMKTEDFQAEGMTAENIPEWWNIIEQKFRKLWDSTIKKKDLPLYGWAANPWVLVIEFKRCEKPKDV